MKVGIYQSFWGWFGGGQHVLGLAADVLSRKYEVEIVHHRADFKRGAIGEGLDLDLSRVQFRCVAPLGRPENGGRLTQRFRRERDWAAELSRPYELFINSSDLVPVFCHAPKGILHTSFPFTTPDEFHARTGRAWQRRPVWVRAPVRAYHEFEWTQRYRTYQLVVTSSEFSRRWLARRWGVRAEVLNPAIRSFQVRHKQPLILSVGRFQANRTGHNKKHAQLIEAFKRLCDRGLTHWQYVLVGGVRDTEENVEYVESLRRLIAGYPIVLAINASGAEVKGFYEAASIFWHAAGYGENAGSHPERMEHFGIATADALGGGCVPIVFNGGGQPEIVRHAVDGFLWTTLDELQDSTLRVIQQPELLRTLSESARTRAAEFSVERFARRLCESVDRIRAA